MAWYKDWFESPYYRLLYQHRNNQEAALFIENLYEKLRLPVGLSILDLCCGEGRHARYLHEKKQAIVTGVDLSERALNIARKYQTESLKFVKCDMRNISFKQEFDLIINLFTSFGYFNSYQDNVKVLKAIKSALKPDGIFVLDYLNVEVFKTSQKQIEEFDLEGIKFSTKKHIEHNRIKKTIIIRDQETTTQFEESIEYLTSTDFNHLFDEAGLEIVQHYGDYLLQPFDASISPRLIIVSGH